MVGTFREVIGNRQIDIVPFSGQPSVSYLWDNAKRLKLFQKLGKKIHIFYYGDFDPTGENIEETIRNKLSLYGVNNIDFRRIALTEEQIRLFNLSTYLDPNTRKKLMGDEKKKGDSNVPKFIEKYGELYQIEIDVLPAIRPEVFRNMVIDSIDQYFDKNIYQDLVNQYPSDSIQNSIKVILRDIFTETD